MLVREAFLYKIRENTVILVLIMTTLSRFDLVIDADEKDALARAAALMGTTMAAFVRVAAKEKAREILERDARVTLSTKEFAAFNAAICGAFSPNPALSSALKSAKKVKRV
jgi:uncharacterized protein (DUF1778 family)